MSQKGEKSIEVQEFDGDAPAKSIKNQIEIDEQINPYSSVNGEKRNEDETLENLNEKMIIEEGAIKENDKFNDNIENLDNFKQNQIKKTEKSKKYEDDYFCEKSSYFENFITPHFIQSIGVGKILMMKIKDKKINDFIKLEEKKLEEDYNDKLINIDEILKVNLNPTFENFNEKRKHIEDEDIFDENPFYKNYIDKLSFNKSQIEYENKFTRELSSISRILNYKEDLLLSTNFSQNQFNYENLEMNFNKNLFLLKKNFHKNLSHQNKEKLNELVKKKLNNPPNMMDINLFKKDDDHMNVKEDKKIMEEIGISSPNKNIFSSEFDSEETNLQLKSFLTKKYKIFFRRLKEFNDDINNQNFDIKMQEDIIYNKFILTNKVFKFHPKFHEILQKYSDTSYKHLKIKMRDNTHFRHNRTNTAINTNPFVNQINNQSGSVISTLNQLLNSLRNTNNLFRFPDDNLFDEDEIYNEYDLEYDENIDDNENDNEYESGGETSENGDHSHNENGLN